MATSAEALTNLQSRLGKQAAVAESEAAYLLLRDFLEQALNEHAPHYVGDFARIASPREKELVLLLAWERICIYRASQCAPQGTTQQSAVTFNADRNTPFDKNMKLAKELRARYENLVAKYAESDEDSSFVVSGDITIGSIYKDGEDVPMHVPIHGAPPPSTPSLEIMSMDSVNGTVVLRCLDIDPQYAAELYVFISTTAGIYEAWNYSGGGAVPIPFAREDAILAYQTTDTKRNVCKVTDLLSVKHFAVCAYRTVAGEWVYSAEIPVPLGDTVVSSVPPSIADVPLSTFE